MPNTRDFHNFSKFISRLLFITLRLMNSEVVFDVADPVPSDDPRHGRPNKGHHVLFNAMRDDHGHQPPRTSYDVVTDGSQVLKHKLADGENTTKRLPRGQRKRPRESKSRCVALANGEQAGYNRTHTGGLSPH